MKAPQDGLLANSVEGALQQKSWEEWYDPRRPRDSSYSRVRSFLPDHLPGERKNINSELWHACAGPLVSLPPVGSLVVYFPQGHSEQVAASIHKETDFVPNYPNLPSKLICMLHNVTLHADLETDEVYAQMTLQPVSKYDKEALLASDIGLKQSRQPTEFFCKTLTASDTSTHGGFSVPRRAAEKIFPPLDYTMQPPAQELVARDLHDTSWAFRHIYRGQPKRHLLTTGWSVFVSTKRLFAGDSVLFIRDEKSQLLLGIRRANKQQPALSSSVISSDSMHIGILASAAHAAANNSPFTIFYNPRASPAEFVIPLAKYNKAMYTQVSLGMRFRMMFETEELGVRRYMGTITGISDLDLVRWKSSQWRNLQVGWDESAAGARPTRVSIWEVEPVITPFYICPPPFFRPKLPKQLGMADDESEIENAFKRAMPWLGDDFSVKDSQSPIFPGLSLVQWMSMQQSNQFPSAQSGFLPSMLSPNAHSLHNSLSTDDPSKLLSFQTPALSSPTPPYNKPNQQGQVIQLQQPASAWPQQQQPQLQPQPQPQQLLQIPTSQQLERQQPQQLAHIQPQHQQNKQVLPQQQLTQQSPSNNGVLVGNQIQNQTLQQPLLYSQLQLQQLMAGNGQTQQHSMNKSFQMTSLPQDSFFQQQTDQQTSLVPRHQQPAQLQQSQVQLLQPGLSQKAQQNQPVQQLAQQMTSDQQLQLQMLQKLQQQQQVLFPANPLLQSQAVQLQQGQGQGQGHQQNQYSSQLPLSHLQQQQNTNGFSTSGHLQSQQAPINQPQPQPKGQFKPLSGMRAQSMTDGDAPSCSTSPSSNYCHVPASSLLNKRQGPVTQAECSVMEPSNNPLQELQSKYDSRIKHEFPGEKGSDLIKFKSTVNDQLEASSSGTSYCLDAGTIRQPFSLPVCLDNDVQSHHRMNIPFTSNIDGLMPDTSLSREYDSQNLLSNYSSIPRDIETELSSAPISPHPFGVPNLPLKPGCSIDVTINDSGAMGSGLWANHNQPTRSYTKVQKRGSVGRCIDVTRYRGYGELRFDLARMFGIEGQLEDPQRTDWKLVYVDHESDILLVGDDPWEEFVSCVQSIKILSSAEVQQMSLAGDLGQIQIQNHTCSGTDSENAWRDDHSAASFNR